MQFRPFGRTGWNVSTIGFGAWAIGGTWGKVDDRESLATLHRALDLGVNFFDTANVYGGGHSEELLARLRRERREPFYITTKAGRGGPEHTVDSYRPERLTAFVERSLESLACETIDLLQIHCPPTEVFYRPEVFGTLDELLRAGKIRFYGASVEKVEEGLKALEYPNLQSVQVVFNMLRQRPAQLLFPEAKRKNVAIIARLPLSSGLLTGKMNRSTQFDGDDHRSFNRNGEAFDKGETFSGIDYDAALAIVDELRPLVPQGMTMAEWALRWIVMHDGVTTAIPGAKRVAQVEANVAAADLPPLAADDMARVRAIYDRLARPRVHQLW